MTTTEGDSKSLLGGADSRTEYFRNRMKMLEEELMKDPRFIRPSILDSNIKEKKEDTVTIQRLNSVLGTPNTVCCIGILVNGEDGHLHIEDETMRIRLNLTKTHSAKDSFFTEGSIVIVEGSNRGGVFWADNIHQPPMIPMPTRNEISEKDHFGAYTYVRNNVLNKIEEIDKLAMNKREDLEDSIDENEGIVIMSNIFLDEPETIHALDRIFTAYESIEAINTFILCGEFISLKKADSLDFEGIKFCFDELARIIKKNLRLKAECRFIITCSDEIFPCPPMLEYFHDTAFQGIENITFACNPCRISFYGKEIVVSRYDYLKRIKKNSYYLGGDLKSEGEDANEVDDITKIANTILSQASLMPLFYLVQPIYWEYAEVLNLNNCPDYLILADTCEQYSLDSLPNAATKVTNPGNFSTNHTFTIVYPLLGKIEMSSLPEEE